MIAKANPDVDVFENTGRKRRQDHRSGQENRQGGHHDLDDAKNGKFSFSAQGDDGKDRQQEFGAGADKLPSWIPTYPGAEGRGHLRHQWRTAARAPAGSFGFSTSDAPPG